MVASTMYNSERTFQSYHNKEDMLCRLLLLSMVVGGTSSLEEEPAPSFRILAPQFVCPQDREASASDANADQSVVRFQMAAGSTERIEWSVRWKSHAALSQRDTLLLWRAVRALEAALNRAPPEPYTYVIENDQLVPGVDYLFNVAAVSEGLRGHTGNFSIAFEDGRRRLDLHGGEDPRVSALLLGSETTYAHADYVVRAQLTMCQPTNDYHYVWTISGATDPSDEVDLSGQSGATLLVPAGSLRGGQHYDISCGVQRTSDDYLLTQVGIAVDVLRRGSELQLGSDELVVSVRRPLRLAGTLYNYDNLPPPLVFEWTCSFNGEPCPSFESVDEDNIFLTSGFPEIGDYEIRLTATAGGESVEASMRVTVVEPSLPLLQVEPMRRLLNEGSVVELVANVSNIAPSCSLTWHFLPLDQLDSSDDNDTCEDCEHGEPLGQTVTIFSMEETFLGELADFSNGTEARAVAAALPAAAGRARLLAACGCSETFSCGTAGAAHADVHFRLNDSPRPADVLVSPASGVALDTVFRLSTLAVEDLDLPVRYTFHYSFGNFTRVPLGSYIDHVADETVLPYIEGGVNVGVTVCDVWGACGSGGDAVVMTEPPAPDAWRRLADVGAAQFRRCELDQLQALAVSSMITFANTERAAELASYADELVRALRASAGEPCLQRHAREYQEMLDLLGAAGLLDRPST